MCRDLFLSFFHFEICPGLNSATKITKTAKIHKGTKKAKQNPDWDPRRITKTANIPKGTKEG